MKKSEESLIEKWDSSKNMNILIMEVPEGMQKEKTTEKNIRMNNG